MLKSKITLSDCTYYVRDKHGEILAYYDLLYKTLWAKHDLPYGKYIGEYNGKSLFEEYIHTDTSPTMQDKQISKILLAYQISKSSGMSDFELTNLKRKIFNLNSGVLLQMLKERSWYTKGTQLKWEDLDINNHENRQETLLLCTAFRIGGVSRLSKNELEILYNNVIEAQNPILIDMLQDEMNLLQIHNIKWGINTESSITVNPKLKKVLKNNDPFIIINYKEPYFKNVYDIVRINERIKGTWTKECENNYLKMIALNKEILKKIKDESINSNL